MTIIATDQRTDNAVLLASELAELNQRHQTIRELATQALDHAKVAGELLLRAKERIPHGQFSQWIAGNCEFSERTARTYMAIAGSWDAIAEKRKRFRNLSVRAAVKLVAEHDEPVSAAISGPHTPYDWEPLEGFLAIGKAGDDRYVVLEAQDDLHVRIACMDGCEFSYLKRGINRHLLGHALIDHFSINLSEVQWSGKLAATPANNPFAEFTPEWKSGVAA